MSTRATYQFTSMDHPRVTFYIHHDGYREGAASYFYQMHHCENHRGGLADKFFRSNSGAEFTGGHEAHGDTEYRYDCDGRGMLNVKTRVGSWAEPTWETIDIIPYWQFCNKYLKLPPEDQLQVVPGITYSDGVPVVRTITEQRLLITEACEKLLSYSNKFPDHVGNIEGIKSDIERLKQQLFNMEKKQAA